MIINPILKRELTVQSRSISIPLLICAVNLVLFIVALLGVFGTMTRMQLSLTRDYAAFIMIYALVVLLEFLLLLFVSPAMTASSLSAERSMETMDLMLTTQMSPVQIVAGKLLSAGWIVAVLLFSCIPAMLLPLLYGGVELFEVAALLFVFAAEAFFLLSAGLFASSLSPGTGRTTAFAYGITAAFLIAIPAASILSAPFFAGGKNLTAYLLVLDPLCTVGSLLLRQIGRGELFTELFLRISLEPDPAFVRFFPLISIAAQMSLSFIFLLLAVTNITPRRRRNS